MQRAHSLASTDGYCSLVRDSKSLWLPQSGNEHYESTSIKEPKNYKHTYEYNENGWLISHTKTGAEATERTEYTYNEGGKCIQEVNFDENLKKTSSVSYKYDEVDTDCIISKIRCSYADGRQIYDTIYDCTVSRNEKGLIQSYTVKEDSYRYTTTITYDSNNQPVSIVEKDDSDTYVYSDFVWDRFDGKLLKYLEWNCNEVESIQELFFYGGCRIKSAKFKAVGYEEYLVTVQYDGNNAFAELKWKRFDANESGCDTYTFKETDEYGSGECVSIFDIDKDESSNQRDSYTAIVKYDSRSNLVLKHEYFSDSMNGEPEKKEYHYTYHPTYDSPSELLIVETYGDESINKKTTRYTFGDFKEFAATGIDQQVQEPQISRQGDYLTVNCPGMKGVRMYDANGRLVRKVIGTDRATLTLGNLPKGVYLVKLDGFTSNQGFKINR